LHAVVENKNSDTIVKISKFIKKHFKIENVTIQIESFGDKEKLKCI